MALPPGFVKEKSTLPPGFVKQQGTSLDSVLEPVRAVASGASRAIVGGLTGLGAAVVPGGRTGAEQVEAVQSGAFQPQTESGQQGLATLGDLAKRGIDIVNFPLSGIGGLIELISGQGIDQAVDTIKSVQERGSGVTAGERVFEETGSPLAATIAQIAPEGAAELLGLKGSGAAVRSAQAGLPTAQNIVSGALQFQSPTKQRIAKLIEEGSTDVETARFKLEEPKALPAPEAGAPRDGPDVLPDAPQAGSKLPEFLNIGGPRVKTDRIAVEAIKQGFDEGVIAAVKGASDADRAKMLEMVDVMEQGKKNARFAVLNRPSDVVGRSLVNRVEVVLDANRQAGKRLDTEAQKLRGQEINVDTPMNEFISDLDSMGVTFDDNLIPNFKGSDIEGLSGPEAAVKRVFARLASPESLDAFEVHRMKRFIDEIVTFGKSGEGLAGRTEAVLKNLRRGLDGVLDNSFPEYNRVNTTYSETIQALDGFQDVAGRKINLTGDNASKAVGTVARRLLSNAQSRVNLLDSINELDSVAVRYGGQFDDDLLTQVLFVDELDSVFGPTARTSFQGQIRQAIPTSKADLVSMAAEKATETIRGVNPEAGFRAIRGLLE